MKNLLLIMLGISLVGGLLFGCAEPAPAPATPAPTPVSPAPTPVSPAPHEPYEIEIYTYFLGTSAYAGGAAIAQFLQDEDSWLKAAILESPSTVANALMLAEKPEKRTKVFSFVGSELAMAYSGMAPPWDRFDPPYTGVKGVCAVSVPTQTWVTNQADIKTPEDLAGKRLGIRPGESAEGMPEIWAEAMIQSGATGAKIVYYDFFGLGDALKDGLVDVAYVAGMLIDPVEGTVVPNPAFMEMLETSEHLNFISYDKGVFDALAEKYNSGYRECVIKPLRFWPTQTNELIGNYDITAWGCHEEMPDDVVYEFLRVIAENAHRFTEFSPSLGAVTTLENMPRFNCPKEWMHPAAIQFYEDMGVDQYIGESIAK